MRLGLPSLLVQRWISTSHQHQPTVVMCIAAVDLPSSTVRMLRKRNVPIYGLWCAGYQDRSETMRLGMLLEPCYPAVEYAQGHTLGEGRQAWLRFLHAQSSVEMVRRRVMALVEEQWRESA